MLDFLYIILLLIVLSTCFVYLVRLLFFRAAPLPGSSQKVFALIQKELSFSSGQTLVELGSGSACLLFFLNKRNPGLKLKGVENFIWPWLWSVVKSFVRVKNIDLRFGNMYQADIAEDDYVYLYLDKQNNERLAKKLKKELKAGAKIISYCFTVPGFKLLKKELIKDKPLYFYSN